MRMQINWNAVTAVCAIVVALFTASGLLTDGLRADIRDLRQEMREGFVEMRQEMTGMRQEMREGFAGMREDIEVLQQDVAFIKGQIRADQTTNGNARRPSGK